MRPEQGDVPPGRSDRWRVTHVGRRVRWSDGVGECAVCGTTVRLRDRHHYATVSPDRSTHRGRADEEVLFCSAACLEAWGVAGNRDGDGAGDGASEGGDDGDGRGGAVDTDEDGTRADDGEGA